MSDRIPVTTHLAMAIIDYVCARRDCSEILEKLQLESYIDRELSFDRGQPGDGIVTLKADGEDAFVMDETGGISSLDGKRRHSLANPAKILIAALFGGGELKQAALSPSEEKDSAELRQAMGLGAPPAAGTASAGPAPAEERPLPPGGGTFLYDRWKGPRLGAELIFNHFQGPGGGAKVWLGLRQDRWDFRVGLQVETVRKGVEEKNDFGFGLILEPIFHLRERPIIFDPYLYLPSLGFYRLLAEEESGISFSPIGAGVQLHVHDCWSIYAGARGLAKLGFAVEPRVGVEIPLGFSAKF